MLIVFKTRRAPYTSLLTDCGLFVFHIVAVPVKFPIIEISYKI